MNLNFKKALDSLIGGGTLFFIKPIVRFLGLILKRDHSLIPQGDIAVIKMLGGGSLVIALGALLAIKKNYPHRKLILITTPPIAPFAKTLNVFDEILILNDSGLLTLVKSSLTVLFKVFKIDTVIDYEVHSKLTTLFSLFTCARNRIGFYRESVSERKYIITHPVFFNLFYGSWYFYEKISEKIGCVIPNENEIAQHFKESNGFVREEKNYICLGHGCSDLGLERMLSAQNWLVALKRENIEPGVELHFLGGPKEKIWADLIIKEVSDSFPNNRFINLSGELKLNQSVEHLFHAKRFIGIDSSLLHYSRLMGLPTKAFFGPTAPISLLKTFSYLTEEILYKQVPCSPCIHASEKPPCNGDNKCIQNLFLS